MTQGMNPAAPHHLPPFITAPGQTDVFLVGCAIFIIIAVITLGSLYFRLHALPEHLSHGKASKLQFEVVSVMALLALFTHNSWFWVAALLLAIVPIPDFYGPLAGMAESLAKMARWPRRRGDGVALDGDENSKVLTVDGDGRDLDWHPGPAVTLAPDLAPRIDGQAERRPKPGIAGTERSGAGAERRHSYRGIPGSIFTILLVSSVSTPLNPLVQEIRKSPLLWLLVAVPVVFVAAALWPDAHAALFILSVVAIVPLAGLLSHATESVAAKTGDAAGGLLNATLGNLTELVIALTALRAGQYTLVKASIAGAIVTNTLFMLGASFLLGGLKYHLQDFNRASARLQAGLLFLATVALLMPSAVAEVTSGAIVAQKLSLGLAALLILGYGLGLLFTLRTHREVFSGAAHAEEGEAPWPIGLALATLGGVTVLVALVSEIFVESVQKAAEAFGMTPAFVGFIVVALVGGAAEMASAFSGARKDRLDLSVGIALGSASQIALFVAPVLVLLSYVIGPSPMDLQFWPGAVVWCLLRPSRRCS